MEAQKNGALLALSRILLINSQMLHEKIIKKPLEIYHSMTSLEVFYGLNSMDKVTKLFRKYIDDLSDISSVN